MKEIHYLLGNACNLNCDFCFWDLRMSDQTLDFKKKIIDEIIKIGIEEVTISGGEAFCTNNLTEVLKYSYQKGLKIVLHSNGLKIDEDMAKEIAPYISRISLTMDAVDSEVQMQMRKNDKITEHTVALIKIFVDLNIPVNIKSLITKINKDEIIKIGKVLENLDIKYWSLLEFIPLNRGALHKDKFQLSSDEFNNISENIKKEFLGMDIRTRSFKNSDGQYCFIAPNADIYTYVKDEGDVLLGNIGVNDLGEIIAGIEEEV